LSESSKNGTARQASDSRQLVIWLAKEGLVLNPFSTLVVPIDFSSHSSKALEYAIAVVKSSGGNIHLVHSYDLPIQVSVPSHINIYEDVCAAVREDANRKLKETLQKLTASGIEGQAHLIHGPPAEVITETAAKIGADLIVVGTRGSISPKHVLLGSVARRTIRTAPCPVMTLRDTLQVMDPVRLRRILVPTDFSESSSAALDLACSIAKATGPAHLILVHAHFLPAEARTLGGAHIPLVKVISQGAAEELNRRMVQLSDEGISADFVNCPGRPERLIVDVAKEKDVDLIIMGRQGRSRLFYLRLGGVAARVLRTAPCPVITTKPPER
jgi:nucleotide-binding universal stress UspA family protein